MKTIDLKKDLKPLYSASAARPALVQVPSMGCLMVDGIGAPESGAFQEAVGSLYSVAYTLKFTFKKEHSIDYPVMALEGLWSTDDPENWRAARRETWRWTLFIVLPDVVTAAHVKKAVADAKKKAKFPEFPPVRFERFTEGRSAQVLHVGPYATEGATIDRLHAFVREQGCRLRGRHHEIYLGDPQRSAPEKLRTILRHPVEKAR
ncbi:MAG TPA: GyrI-like domain-containing protein [Spirochaetia bacterium]|nr:GyrI-like domain-containing protein [Spirochaetia bacterium]